MPDVITGPGKIKDNPAFAAAASSISGHIGTRSAAMKAYLAELQNEVVHHAGHAYTRHGPQAGWLEQVIRCVTQMRPDQAFSPFGVEAAIREWNARAVAAPGTGTGVIVKTYDSSGSAVLKTPVNAGYVPKGYEIDAGKGGESGGFFSPELEKTAWDKAFAIANTITYTEAEFPVTKKRKTPWMPFTRIQVVVDSKPHLFFGMGYKRAANFVPRTREQVLAIVEKLYADKPAAPTDGSKRKSAASISDVLAELGVECNDSSFQKSATVILDRAGTGWSRVTMFPCQFGDTGKWAPSIGGVKWTGGLRQNGSPHVVRMPVPSWLK